MEKTADLAMVQKTVIGALHKEGKSQRGITINGVGSAGTPWSVTPAVHYSDYFQGIMLETLL